MDAIMPRTSQSALTTLEVVESASSSVEVVRRVRPPDELTHEQRVEFLRVVGEMPAEWFTTGNTAMLVQYCRHVVTARRIAELIEAAISEGKAEELDKLVRAQDAQSKMLNTLMTSLRMTPRAVAPSTVSQKRMQQIDSPWRGFGQKR
jgi:hypothetical protein